MIDDDKATLVLNWRPSQRYPDPLIRVIDETFNALRLPLSKVEQIATGCRWAEGPVWIGDLRSLIWSDIPNNRLLRWDEESGATTVFRKPSGYANGATRDRQGRIIHCEHGGRRVVRTELDGLVVSIAERFEGKRLNSPNDVVCKSDGSIWFTDPSFGILGWYEGSKATQELPTHVYRLGVDGGLEVVAEGINQPNGLAFSPDESILYIVESRAIPRKSSPLTLQVMEQSLRASGCSLKPKMAGHLTDSALMLKATFGVGGVWVSKASTGCMSLIPTVV